MYLGLYNQYSEWLSNMTYDKKKVTVHLHNALNNKLMRLVTWLLLDRRHSHYVVFL